MLDDLLQGRDLDSLTDDEKMAVLVKAGLMTSDSPAAAAAPAPQQVAAAADDEDPPRTEAERLAYLRSRGVEVELAEERQSHPPPAAGGAGRAFTFVRIPAEPTVAVSLESAAAPSGGGDVLPGLLAPRFADDGVMDDATVARETAGRLRNMVAGGAPGAAEALRAPSAETVQKLAAGGACEAYPLAQPSAANGWVGVRLYIDEVGALRSRPRNARAEALALAAGLSGLAIHGDVYVSRCARREGGGGGEGDASTASPLTAPGPTGCCCEFSRRGQRRLWARRAGAGLGVGGRGAEGERGGGGGTRRRRPLCGRRQRQLRVEPDGGGGRGLRARSAVRARRRQARGRGVRPRPFLARLLRRKGCGGAAGALRRGGAGWVRMDARVRGPRADAREGGREAVGDARPRAHKGVGGG
uniref:Uncharacterized protein n=1 Tax=Emiliania huxleyi TaxID=2903 RepID=A0A7S3S9T9_EMIHU